MRSVFPLFIIIILLTACTIPRKSNTDVQNIRIVSYNIRHSEGMDGQIDLERIANVISKLNPDLVALQEVDYNCKRSRNQDIAAALGRLLGMDHRFGKFMDYQGGEYGMAILSRYSITNTVRHPLPEGAEPRCALEVQVHVNDLPLPISFVCIHNDWTNEMIRVKQIQALLESLEGKEHPIILAGDFNGERTDKSLLLFQKSQWEILNRKDQNTYPSDNPVKEIDFIITRGFSGITYESKVIDERLASDHRPVLVNIFINHKPEE